LVGPSEIRGLHGDAGAPHCCPENSDRHRLPLTDQLASWTESGGC